jgi:hypothetical protein
MLNKNTIDNKQKILLIVSALGLLPIALSYGLIPNKTLPFLFNISMDNLNTIHIMRAVMGLYLAQICFWFIGAVFSRYRLAAMYGLAVFMLGLAFGRLISIIFDGIPNWLLSVYLFLELFIGLLAILLIKKAS